MISDPRHRAHHHQLWIDKVRAELDDAISPAEFEWNLKIDALHTLLGGIDIAARDRLFNRPRDQLALAFSQYGLADPLRVAALKTLKAKGYPQRGLTADDWPACEAKVGYALSWCAYDILRSSQTRIMLLDDRTAKAVADSKNEPITAAELQHLPHNPCLIEFYRPIEIAEKIKRDVRLCAVGFESIGDPETPAAVVSFYLDYWVSSKGHGSLQRSKSGLGALSTDPLDAAHLETGGQRGRPAPRDRLIERSS